MFAISVSPTLIHAVRSNISRTGISRRIRCAGIVLVGLFTLLSIACAGPLQGFRAPGAVSIALTPATPSVASGTHVQFTAAVSGTNNTAVTWVASAGSISSTGLFTAPSVTSNTSVTVTATSAAALSAKASAVVTVTTTSGTAPGVVVSLTPTTASVASGAQVQFAATVSGTANTAVTWTATLGNVDSTGNYTAPSVTTTTTDRVSAVSVSDPTKYGTSSVTVKPLSQGTAREYWVSPTGSDSSDGSVSHPWASINHAISAFTLGSGGTIIHVGTGTYNSIVSCTSSSSSNMCVSRGGSSNSDRLVIQCDSKWSCKLSGGAVGINVVANYVDIVGFDVGNTASMFSGIFVPCQGTCGTGSASTTGNSIHVIGNYVHDLASAVNTGRGAGCPWTGAIEFSNQHGPYMTDVQAIGNLIARFGNYNLTNCQLSHGIYADTPNFTAYNNIIAKVPTSGIQFYSSECSGRISNNTIMSSPVGIINTPSTPTACSNPGHVTVDNNIIVNTTKWAIQAGTWDGSSPDCTSSTPVLYSHNITDGSSADFNSGGIQSCDTVTGTVHEAPATTFVNYKADGTGDYHLKSGSAAIYGGVTTCVSGGLTPCVPSDDFDGNSRPSGSAYDVGVY